MGSQALEFTRRHFIGAAFAATAGLAAASCTTAPRQVATPQPLPTPTPTPLAEVVPEPGLDLASLPPLIAEALTALETNAVYLTHRDKIGVVDFGLPSSEPRFHLVDAATGQIERSWLVAHGSGSDPGATGMLQRFSNVPGSNATSRGAYLTANPYYGQHGLSRRLIGLESDNNMAMDRAIVIHGAEYVNRSLIASQGRIGRSQGCFAFEQHEVGRVMDLLGEGRMIYAGKLA